MASRKARRGGPPQDLICETIEEEELVGYLLTDDTSDRGWEEYRPWEKDTVTFVVKQNRHFSGDEDLSADTPREDNDEYYVMPVYSYVHGGVSLSLGRGYPFNCPWDSGQCGFLLLSKKEFKDRENAEENAAVFIKCWNQYSNGEIYIASVYKKDGNHLELVDSCGGYMGSEYALEELKSMMKSVTESRYPLITNIIAEHQAKAAIVPAAQAPDSPAGNAKTSASAG